MVVEYIRYRVPPDRGEEFESAWSEAQQVLREHEHDFRASAAFGRFFAAVKPFFEQIEEMRHYQPTAVRSAL